MVVEAGLVDGGQFGHPVARFDGVRVADPLAEGFPVEVNEAGAEGGALRQVGKVGGGEGRGRFVARPDVGDALIGRLVQPAGVFAEGLHSSVLDAFAQFVHFVSGADGVAGYALAAAEENQLSLLGLGIQLRRRAPAVHPGGVFHLLQGVDAELHLRVGSAAELGALAVVHPRILGEEPHFVGFGGDDILLAGQFGDPKAVDDIVAFEFHYDGRINRNTHFVGGGNQLVAAVGRLVAELPPPLVADGLHPQRLAALLARQGDGLVRFQFKQDEHRPDAQRQNQHGGDDRPGDFQRRVAVGLGRQRVAGLAAEADGGVQQRALHQNEHGDHRPEQHIKEEQLLPGHGAVDAEGGLGRIGIAAQRGQQQRAAEDGQKGQETPAPGTGAPGTGGSTHRVGVVRSGLVTRRDK